MYRMHRVVMAVLALGLVVGTVSVASAAARSPEELRPFLLTAAELGAGFTEDEHTSDPSPPPSYLRSYSRTRPSHTVVVTMLLSEDRDSPRTWVEVLQIVHQQDDVFAALTSGGGLVPGGFGSDAWAVVMVGRVGDRDAAGVIVAWRSADITAVMDVLAERAPGETDDQLAARIMSYPLRQRDKIRSALTGELPVAQSASTSATLVTRAMPSPPPAFLQALTAPSRGLLPCESFQQETAPAVPRAYPGDAHGLANEGNRVPCVDRAFRAADEPTRAQLQLALITAVAASPSASPPTPAMPVPKLGE